MKHFLRVDACENNGNDRVQTRLKAGFDRVQNRFPFRSRLDAILKIFGPRLDAFLVLIACRRDLEKLFSRVWTRFNSKSRINAKNVSSELRLDARVPGDSHAFMSQKYLHGYAHNVMAQVCSLFNVYWLLSDVRLKLMKHRKKNSDKWTTKLLKIFNHLKIEMTYVDSFDKSKWIDTSIYRSFKFEYIFIQNRHDNFQTEV